jgi:hypothetical protein
VLNFYLFTDTNFLILFQRMESFALDNASAIISTNLLEAAAKTLKDENNEREKMFRSSTLNSAVNCDLELFFKTAHKLELVEDDPFEEFWKEESTLRITQLQAALSGDKLVATDSACVTLVWDDTIPKSKLKIKKILLFSGQENIPLLHQTQRRQKLLHGKGLLYLLSINAGNVITRLSIIPVSRV